MTSFMRVLVFTTGALLAALSAVEVSAAPVIATHPRLLFNTSDKSRLLTKKTTSDPSWQALKIRADTLAGYTIQPYKFATNYESPLGRSTTPTRRGWLSATHPPEVCVSDIGDTAYSSELIELAQEDPRRATRRISPSAFRRSTTAITPHATSRPRQASSTILRDHLGDQPTNARRTWSLMNQFDDVHVNGYQAQISVMPPMEIISEVICGWP